MMMMMLIVEKIVEKNVRGKNVRHSFLPAHTSPNWPCPNRFVITISDLLTSKSLNGIGSGSLGQAFVRRQHRPSSISTITVAHQ